MEFEVPRDQKSIMPIENSFSLYLQNMRCPAFLRAEQRGRERTRIGLNPFALFLDMQSITQYCGSPWTKLHELLDRSSCSLIGITNSPIFTETNSPSDYDAIIAGGGSYILLYDAFQNSFRLDHVYQEMLCSTWNVRAAMKAIRHASSRYNYENGLRGCGGLKALPESEMGISFLLKAEQNQAYQFVQYLEEEISFINEEEAECLCLQVKLNPTSKKANEFRIDLTPQLASETYALQYLIERFNFKGLLCTANPKKVGAYISLGKPTALLGVEIDETSECSQVWQPETTQAPLITSLKADESAIIKILKDKALNLQVCI